MLDVIMVSVIMLNVVMLNVILLNVILLNVVGAFQQLIIYLKNLGLYNDTLYCHN
jgi:hypothetical protein